MEHHTFAEWPTGIDRSAQCKVLPGLSHAHRGRQPLLMVLSGVVEVRSRDQGAIRPQPATAAPRAPTSSKLARLPSRSPRADGNAAPSTVHTQTVYGIGGGSLRAAALGDGPRLPGAVRTVLIARRWEREKGPNASRDAHLCCVLTASMGASRARGRRRSRA